jgi:hypothetical protein
MIEEITIVNNTQQSEFTMDKLTTEDYILERVNFGEVPIDYTTNRFLNQIGSTVSYQKVSEREIEIVGNIIADSELQMTERKVFLNKFFNPIETFTAKYKNYTIDFRLERSIRYTAEERTNNEVVCNFKVEAIAHYPLFLEKEATNEIIAGFRPMFHFPLILREDLHNEVPPALHKQRGIVFGKKNKDTKTAIISNLGDVEVGMEIIIMATGGTVENPKIINILTGEFFEINKTMADGEVIKINTELGKKSIIGSIDGEATFTNYFMYKTLNSTWLVCRKGANSFEYEAINGEDNLQIDVKYTSAYMEVQQCF